MNATLTQVSTVEQFKQLEDAWNALLLETQADNIFLTHDWLRVWWRFFGQGNDLWVLTAREDGRLVGIAPFMRRRSSDGVRWVSFLGTGDVVPNHLDFIVSPVRRDEFVKQVCEFLWRKRADWDLLDLTALPEDSPTRDLMTEKFRHFSIWSQTQYYAPCPYAVLPASFDTYLQTRSPETRGQFRSKQRRLMRKHPDACFGRAQTAEEVERVFSALAQLHQTRWQKFGFPGSFANEELVQFHLTVMQSALLRGSLRLYYLKIGADYVAVYYCYRVGRRVMYYSSGFDERWHKFSIGIQLLAYAMEQSITEGAVEFDFLQGDERYKSEWATHTRGNWRLKAASPHFRGRLIWTKLRILEMGRAIGCILLPLAARRALKRMLAA